MLVYANLVGETKLSINANYVAVTTFLVIVKIMSCSIYPITPAFAAEVGDVDLQKPISKTVFSKIENAFNKYSVLIFPGQDISENQQLRFSKKFGSLETTIQKFRKGVNLRLGSKFADVSNLTSI